MTEKEKSLSGQLYDASDPVLSSERKRTRLLFQEINQLSDDHKEKRNRLFLELIGEAGANLFSNPPFGRKNKIFTA